MGFVQSTTAPILRDPYFGWCRISSCLDTKPNHQALTPGGIMATAEQRTTTVVGVLEDQHRADQAVGELKRAGFREDQIGVAFRHNEGTTQTTSSEHGTHTGTGAMTGVLTGL